MDTLSPPLASLIFGPVELSSLQRSMHEIDSPLRTSGHPIHAGPMDALETQLYNVMEAATPESSKPSRSTESLGSEATVDVSALRENYQRPRRKEPTETFAEECPTTHPMPEEPAMPPASSAPPADAPEARDVREHRAE